MPRIVGTANRVQLPLYTEIFIRLAISVKCYITALELQGNVYVCTKYKYYVKVVHNVVLTVNTYLTTNMPVLINVGSSHVVGGVN